jgi:hypothetical protein
MSPRTFMKPRDPGTLKDAQASLIEACGGISKARCRVKKTVLQTYADKDRPECNMPADVIADLEAQCGKPIVTGFLALQANCFLERVGDHPTNEPCSIVLGRMTEDTGRILSAAAQDVHDGNLTAANAEIVLRQTDDMIVAIAELREDARNAIAGRGQ